MERNEQVYTYALSRILMYEPRIARSIIETFSDAETIFTLDQRKLESVMGPYNRFTLPILNADLAKYDKELEALEKRGYRYMIHSHSHFPTLLSQCEDAPIGLFIRSADSLENIFGNESISVVGTRRITSYGQDWCRKIVSSFGGSKQKPTIVSGLAFGVDITAHLSALESGLPTIAVLGTGIGNIYPVQHERHAERIMQTKGSAIISEYPTGCDVTPVNFLSRNRIIAGLSRATIIIESKLTGGAMSTARAAASYNRDVFALPGRNDDCYSKGCNFLIQSHIAEAIVGCDELFKSINYSVRNISVGETQFRIREFYAGSMEDEKIGLCERLFMAIRKNRGISIEELSDAVGFPYGKTAALLQRMENDGFIDIDLLQCCSISSRKSRNAIFQG